MKEGRSMTFTVGYTETTTRHAKQQSLVKNDGIS